jgi:mRNA-degrading endonuclease RelE of RelBE toxin-antitoxin system
VAPRGQGRGGFRRLGTCAGRKQRDQERKNPEPQVDAPKKMTIIEVKMVRRKRFHLVYAPRTKEHVRAIEPRHHSLIKKAIEDQLTYEPDVETRNRKPLKRPVLFQATWEIRFGPRNCFRVFYDVDVETHGVNILAVGVKEREQLFIGGKEMEP